MRNDLCEEGLTVGLPLQDRTIIAVISENAMSAPAVPSSAEIRSHSEEISRRSRLLIADSFSAALPRIFPSGLLIARTETIFDMDFLSAISAYPPNDTVALAMERKHTSVNDQHIAFLSKLLPIMMRLRLVFVFDFEISQLR
jgi:hypothetical protein